MSQRHAYRAAILHCLADPSDVGEQAAHAHFADGLLVVEDGKIAQLGDAAALMSTLDRDIPVRTYTNALIVPGFIDTHIHFPQIDIIGAYGAQLLDWLETYTFPNEARYADAAFANRQAERFVQELLRNGTTTAMVFGSVHPQSVDAFFTQAERHNLRMICGKVLMDRNAPEYLTDTAESGYAQSRALIERWHGKGRLHYAVTPRFAPTSTPAQLTRAGQLLREYPGLFLQTHLSENRREIAWVAELFPERSGYLDVYDHYGLIGPRAVFAHGVHLHDRECRRLGETGSAIAFCPTSNLFLGSGLFDLQRAQHHGIRIGLGTDVGAGTSFSALQTLNEAYKVLQLQGQSLAPFSALYLATLGGARALYLDEHIGNLLPGKDADFVVLDLHATPLLRERLSQSDSLREQLFALFMLGDDRCVLETFAAGASVHRR